MFFYDIAEIDRALQQAFAQSHHTETTMALLQHIGTKSSFRHMLRNLLDNEERLRRIASMSYHHRNGFDRIVLVKSEEPAYKLRLHLWWPEYAEQHIEAIHNHAWNFSSVVLTGAFQFQSYTLSPQEKGRQMYHYRAGTDSSLTFQEKVKIACVYDAMIQAGYSYCFDHTVPHRVINAPNTVTSTLILQGPNQKTYSDVFTEQPFGEQSRTAIPKLTGEELTTKLQRYLLLLEA